MSSANPATVAELLPPWGERPTAASCIPPRHPAAPGEPHSAWPQHQVLAVVRYAARCADHGATSFLPCSGLGTPRCRGRSSSEPPFSPCQRSQASRPQGASAGHKHLPRQPHCRHGVLIQADREGSHGELQPPPAPPAAPLAPARTPGTCACPRLPQGHHTGDPARQVATQVPQHAPTDGAHG